MKKLLFSFTLVFLFSLTSFAVIPWGHRYTPEQADQNITIDINTPFTVSIEWGEGDWTFSDFGYGLTTDGTDWTWTNIGWFQDGAGTNKRCKTTINISTPGKYYYAFRIIKGGDTSYQLGSSDWSQNTTILSASSYLNIGEYSVADGLWSSSSNWNNAVIPGSTKNVGIYHQVNLDENATVNSINIFNGKKLTVDAGKQLTVSSSISNSGTIELSSGETGTATILTPATLSGSGNYNINQYLSSGRNWYLSSPVSNATTSALSSANSIAYYNEPTSSFVTFGVTSDLLPMKGYLSVSTVSSGNITFSGSLNNGNQSIGLTRDGSLKAGFNLVGNPYPSHLTLSKATMEAANTNTTIWYRTKAAAYAFHTINLTSNVKSPETTTNIIPPMQAFWVRVNASGGTLNVDNTMRSHQSSNPLKAPAEVAVENKLIRMEVSNGVNQDETVIYFNNNASDLVDNYDSPKMFNDASAVPEIFTKVNDESMVINGLNSISNNLEIPLSFKTGQANTFTLRATQLANLDADKKVYLKDKLLNITREITPEMVYTFDSEIVNTDNRFSLNFAPAVLTDDVHTVEKSVTVFLNVNNQITIHSGATELNTGTASVYDLSGRILIRQNLNSNTTFLHQELANGAYIVQVKVGNQNYQQKVILK